VNDARNVSADDGSEKLPADRAPLRYTFKTEPYAHQRKALAKILRHDGRLLVAMPMRTGKTKVSIDAAGIAYYNFGLRRVLIVTPLSVMGVWRDEIAAHCPVPSRVTILSGSIKERAKQLAELVASAPFEGLDWVITNYESTWRNVTSDKHRMQHVLADWLGDGLLVTDESHRVKNPTSRQARALAYLGAKARFSLALTGTPITKGPLDALGQFRVVDRGILCNPETGRPWEWGAFKEHYGAWGGFERRELIGYRHLDELIPVMREHMFRVRLESCFDLPPRTFVDVPIRLSEKARGVYRTMAKEMLVELESGKIATAPIVLTKVLRLLQITSGFLRTEDGTEEIIDTAKLDACMDLLGDMVEQGEKAVVFCRFKQDYTRVMDACRRARYGPLLLAGSTPQASREGIIRRFRDDPACKVFVAQTAAGSLGIDLTAARFSIFYSLDYNWATYAQALDRIYGPKQTRPVTIHHLIAPRTFDRLVLNVLQARGDLARQVLHDPKGLLDAFSGD
jgi:SNF2 family DNA or RNA helicase